MNIEDQSKGRNIDFPKSAIDFLNNEVDWGTPGGWRDFVRKYALVGMVEVIEGDAPKIYSGKRPIGPNPWKPIHEKMQREIFPSFRKIKNLGTEKQEVIEFQGDWKGPGVYILWTADHFYQYPKGKSSIYYIGKMEGVTVIGRVCDHFYHPKSDYTMWAFGAKVINRFFEEESFRKHKVTIIQDVRLKTVAKEMEKILIRSFKSRYGDLPAYNGQSV